MSELSLTKRKLSIKAQTFATLAAIFAAVALPQVFHTIGAISGTGTAIASSFLPMHLPIILVGLLAGPYAGLIAGAFSPLISFFLSSMPTIEMLPFMVIELAVYGLSAGLIKNANIPSIGKVLLIQVTGRAVRALAILISVYVFANESISAIIIWKSISDGIFGLILQWALIPLIVFWIDNKTKNEQ